jgi:hypothetical protein
LASDKKKCFVISPIGTEGSPERERADTVLKYLIKKALSPEFDVIRADDDTNPGAITPRIVQSILEADLVIADITGSNANVFYELAIAHGYRKPTVHLQESSEHPPFDIKDMRILAYDTTNPGRLEKAQESLKAFVASALQNPEAIETPLRTAHQFEAARASGDVVAQTNVQVMEAIEDLRTEVRSIAIHPSRGGFRHPLASLSGADDLPEDFDRAEYVRNLENRAKALIRETHNPTMASIASSGGYFATQEELRDVRERLREVYPSSAYI